MFSANKGEILGREMPLSSDLDCCVEGNEGGFMYILRCEEKLEALVSAKFAAIGSMFGFRKFGQC